jgi:hypothetical protein
LLVHAEGFGLGWRLLDNCDFAQIVFHNGGGWGFGAALYLLPERGVAVVALSNLQHVRVEVGPREALKLLDDGGGLAKRALPPSDALRRAQAEVVRLLAHWDDSAAARLLAPNVFVQQFLPRMRATWERAAASHGACRVDGELVAKSPWEATWGMTCDRGRLTLGVEVAPSGPPRIVAAEVLDESPATATNDGGSAVATDAGASAEAAPRAAPPAGKCSPRAGTPMQRTTGLRPRDGYRD